MRQLTRLRRGCGVGTNSNDADADDDGIDAADVGTTCEVDGVDMLDIAGIGDGDNASGGLLVIGGNTGSVFPVAMGLVRLSLPFSGWGRWGMSGSSSCAHPVSMTDCVRDRVAAVVKSPGFWICPSSI